MSTNEPTKKTTPLTAEEIKRRRQDRLASAVSPQPSGYSGPREVYREPQQPIDWRLWVNLDDVALWEACLLSLNINPSGAERMAKASVFTNAGTALEYETRLRLLVSNRKNSNHFTLPVRMTPERVSRVLLPEFAAWALHLGFQTMPPELIALASKEPPAPAQRAAEPALADTSGDSRKVETIEHRRARYLEWHSEELRINKRGALQRVFERERLQNPTADRSAIGKDIAKARDMKRQPTAGTMFGQLVKDGKRQN